MVINGKKLWEGQTDYIQARMLERKYAYDLFVTGDNHQSFTKGKVINCGSLMRMKKDQADHVPIYGIYDTETKKLETFEYDIAPASVVFDLDDIEKRRISSEKKENFVNSLNLDFEGEIDFRANVQHILSKKRRTKARTRQILEEALR
jgi:hypothetical protein